MTRPTTHIVLARSCEGRVEIRCGLCTSWWPATEEFYRRPNRCRACDGDIAVMDRANVVAWEPGWSYLRLAHYRDRLPSRLVTEQLRRAVRRAYWREFKREKRRVSA